VDMMGGADALVRKAQDYYENGEYRWVAEVVNHAVFADPSNQAAKNLQADALEQLGYQAESGPWRNFYLTGAKELREGVMQLPAPNTASPDTIRAMSLELFFDYLGMKLNGPKADDKQIVLNFDFTDVKQKYLVEMVHGVLNHTANTQADTADATITLTRDTLNQIVLGQTTLDKAVSDGDVKITGSKDKLKELLSYLDTFDFWFNIVTP
jgi:alkyl sulfatase BDS1-like metallo-beta-lactamase superfamily hydrolase